MQSSSDLEVPVSKITLTSFEHEIGVGTARVTVTSLAYRFETLAQIIHQNDVVAGAVYIFCSLTVP